MHLIVKQADSTINEFQFTAGPVHIGRHADSQIFLSDRAISRHHAVIFSTNDGKWMVEDLDSTNKTYLNDRAIHKTELKTGDSLLIGDFTIEINLEDNIGAKGQRPINLEDTLTTSSHGLEDTMSGTLGLGQVIVRRIDSKHAPDLKLPAKRVREFMEATDAICKSNALDEVLHVLLNIAVKQLSPFHVWCALRNQPTGSMTCHAGKQRGGTAVELADIKLSEKINEAIDKGFFFLFPRIPAAESEQAEPIHSAMIAPIMSLAGCLGVLYIDNAMDHEHYSLSDLDYLILISIHTSVILENF